MLLPTFRQAAVGHPMVQPLAARAVAVLLLLLLEHKLQLVEAATVLLAHSE
jgi:hypothetical protein